MTEEMTKLEALQNKLGNICDENGFTYRFHKEGYPLHLIIRPEENPGGQMSLIDNNGQGDTGTVSPDAFITFSFVGGDLKYETSDKFEISAALFNKIKGNFEKMHARWLQHFHHEVMQNNLLSSGDQQRISTSSRPEPAVESGEDPEDGSDGAEDDDAGAALPEGTAADETAEGDAPAPGLAEEAELVEEAIKIVRETGKATTSLLQKKLAIGYAKASRLLEALEARGVVGPYNGSAPREVLPAGDGNE